MYSSVGMCRPVPQILTLFQTKTRYFLHSFSESKIHTSFQTLSPRNYECHHYLDKEQQRKGIRIIISLSFSNEQSLYTPAVSLVLEARNGHWTLDIIILFNNNNNSNNNNNNNNLWTYCAQPREGGVLPYMGYIGMCRCEGYGFQAVYSRIGYINQSDWL